MIRVRLHHGGHRPDETIGDFGLVGGGAAGYELDRYDLLLGTPPETLLLAYRRGTPTTIRTSGRSLLQFPDDGRDDGLPGSRRHPYFTTKNGGGVFSTGSIAWCGSLLENDSTTTSPA